MTDEGFGVILRFLVVAISIGFTAVVAFLLPKLWRKITLSQRAVGLYLLLIQAYIILVNIELLEDGSGWRWRLLLLIAAQFCLMAFLFEPISLRQQRRQQYLDALDNSTIPTHRNKTD